MTPLLAKIILVSFTVLVFFYGLHMSIGSIKNWNSFNNVYKRIDFTDLFGDFGRIIYVVFGLIISIGALMCLLGMFQIGPYSEEFRFK